MDLEDIRRANLLLLIRELGVTQKEFADLVHYNPTYVGHLLNRDRRAARWLSPRR